MKSTYISIIVLVVLVAGGLFIFAGGKKAQAPESGTQPTTSVKNNPSQSEQSTTPVPAQNTAGVVKEFTVTGQNFSFTPSALTVKKGDTVKITLKNANGMHNLKIDEFNVGTQIIKGGTQETIQFVADKTGSFQYYCSVGSHRAMGMWGTLKVE